MPAQQKERSIRSLVSRKDLIWLFAGAVMVVAGVLFYKQSIGAIDVVVYRSPTCGCCGEWVNHLEENGFSVEVHNHHDMSQVKKELEVPGNLQSCHTAKVDGYVIEGHVPADVISRLLQEKPAIKGLAVPGMPMGSPGMEGPRSDPYDVLAFQANGKTAVYTSHNQ